MSKKTTYSVYEHRLPGYFFRFPFLIRPVHWGHQLLHNRNRIVLQMLKRYMRMKKGKGAVFEAGCGEGNYLIPLARRYPKSSFVGVDYNAHLVQFVNAYAQRYTCPIEVQQVDLNDCLLTGKYDVVMCVAVLHMLKDDEAFLKQLCTLLKPGGMLLVNVPIAHAPILPQRKGPSYHDVHGGMARKYTVESLCELLDDAGFAVMQTRATNTYWGTLGNEVLNVGLDTLQASGLLLRGLLLPIFLLVLVPLVGFLNLLNSLLPTKMISGVVVTATIKA